jgi:hypothetical protein
VTGNEPGDVLEYWLAHETFPHESTTDQWFTESQFESYRNLGYSIAGKVFEGADVHAGRKGLFDYLQRKWPPPRPAADQKQAQS